MRVDILGPLRVTRDGDVVACPMAKERALLEALALRPSRTVPLAQLEAALWGEDPPATAARTLQAHVARLRHDVGTALVRRDPGGYRLAVDPQDVDASQLETLVTAGEAAFSDGQAQAARGWFRQAEVLWRGDPLADLADTPERLAQAGRLEELWQQAREGRIRADLALGRHREVLSELRRMAADLPTREPVCALLMLALYRAGSPLEALHCYARTRRDLIREWGVAPSAELRHLQGQVLRQDPRLDLRPPPPVFLVPASTSRLVGRRGQVEGVAEAMQRSRLVTLHGPAGIGKSRLAVAVAERMQARHRDGVWWVDLTLCSTGDCVARLVAETLAIPASPGPPLADWIGSRLASRDALIVLDNCEQVAVPVAGLLARVLARAPRLRVVATSRVGLGAPGEVLWEVPPLEVPDRAADDEAILACESVRLFLDRLGRATDPAGRALVADLCRTLEGVPLALELIAARATHGALAEIVAHLPAELVRESRALAWPPHHASVGKAIEWSYAGLPAATRHLLDRLSVAPGELDLAAVIALGAGAGLSQEEVPAHLVRLVEASLVRAEPGVAHVRYRLLFVVREFAAERLRDRGETRTATQAYVDHVRDLCARAAPALESEGSGRWLQAMLRETANLRAAVAWSLEHDPPTTTLAFSRVLGRVAWVASADLAADAALLRRIVMRADSGPAGDRAWGWLSVVTASYLAGDVDGALAACERAEALFGQADDQRGLAVLHWHWGATLLLAVGDMQGAQQHLRTGLALASRTGTRSAEAWCLAHLVQRAYFVGHVTEEAQQFQARAERLVDPADAQLQAHLGMNRSGLRWGQGALREAAEAARWTASFSRGAGMPGYEQAALCILARAQEGLQQLDEARLTSLRAARLALDMGNRMQMGLALLCLSAVEDARDPVGAARLFGAGAARAPAWPGFWAPGFPARAREALSARFDDEAAAGASLSAEEALELAIG